MSTKKNIVIVGGGGAGKLVSEQGYASLGSDTRHSIIDVGAVLARILSEKLDPALYSLSLITPREYFLHLPGALRMLVSLEGNLEHRVLVPYDKLLVNGNGTIIQEAATSIRRNSSGIGGTVTTDTGRNVQYDVLVLASGSHWEGGLDLPPLRADAIRSIQDYRGVIKASKGVAIIGGGAVGTGTFLFLSTTSANINRTLSRTCRRNSRRLPGSCSVTV